ncbi:globin-1-like [Liolophura sinensis]|uniref:globin-1-like n=1 Tax=Liolophura sinensis TaxID=3198878 RepID=UPI0031585530
MSINPGQIKALKECMVIIREDIRGNGAAFFEKMFATYPAWQEKFPAWKGNSLEQVKSSVRIRAHGTSVFSELGKFVDSMDDMDVLKDLLKRSGMFHTGKGIGIEYFQKVGDLLVSFLKERLGGKFTGDMEGAWRAVWPIIVEGLKAGM